MTGRAQTQSIPVTLILAPCTPDLVDKVGRIAPNMRGSAHEAGFRHNALLRASILQWHLSLPRCPSCTLPGPDDLLDAAAEAGEAAFELEGGEGEELDGQTAAAVPGFLLVGVELALDGRG